MLTLRPGQQPQAQTIQCADHAELLNRSTTAAIAEPLRSGLGPVWARHGEMHEAHRFLRRPSIGTGHPTDGNPPVADETLSNSLGSFLFWAFKTF